MTCERCHNPYRVRYHENGEVEYYCNICNRHVWFGPEPDEWYE